MVRTLWKVRARTHRLLAVLVPAVFVIVVAVITASIGGASGASGVSSNGSASGGKTPGPAQPVWAGSALGAATPGPASAAHGRTSTGTSQRVRADLPQAAVTPGAKWLTGPAGKLLAAVNSDVGKISADMRGGKNSAAASAGERLAADAGAALSGPMPPVDAAVYRSALKEFEQIGADTATSDFRTANSLLAPANLGVLTVTAAVNRPAPVNPPAQVNEPNGG